MKRLGEWDTTWRGHGIRRFNRRLLSWASIHANSSVHSTQQPEQHLIYIPFCIILLLCSGHYYNLFHRPNRLTHCSKTALNLEMHSDFLNRHNLQKNLRALLGPSLTDAHPSPNLSVSPESSCASRDFRSWSCQPSHSARWRPWPSVSIPWAVRTGKPTLSWVQPPSLLEPPYRLLPEHPILGQPPGHVMRSVGIFSCWETSQDGIVDPGPQSSLSGRAVMRFSHCPLFMFYTLTPQVPLRNGDVV